MKVTGSIDNVPLSHSEYFPEYSVIVPFWESYPRSSEPKFFCINDDQVTAQSTLWPHCGSQQKDLGLWKMQEVHVSGGFLIICERHSHVKIFSLDEPVARIKQKINLSSWWRHRRKVRCAAVQSLQRSQLSQTHWILSKTEGSYCSNNTELPEMIISLGYRTTGVV
jgi:hypothetical protein